MAEDIHDEYVLGPYIEIGDQKIPLNTRTMPPIMETFGVPSSIIGPYDPYETKPLAPPETKSAYEWIAKSVFPVTDGTFTIHETTLGSLDIVDTRSGDRVYLAANIDDFNYYVQWLENEAFTGRYQREFQPENKNWRQGE